MRFNFFLSLIFIFTGTIESFSLVNTLNESIPYAIFWKKQVLKESISANCKKDFKFTSEIFRFNSRIVFYVDENKEIIVPFSNCASSPAMTVMKNSSNETIIELLFKDGVKKTFKIVSPLITQILNKMPSCPVNMLINLSETELLKILNRKEIDKKEKKEEHQFQDKEEQEHEHYDDNESLTNGCQIL